MDWDLDTQNRFKEMICRIPVFHRGFAEEAVTKRAEETARLRNSPRVEELDVISAFFSDVPSPFYNMMIRLLGQSGFDYKRYGFPKNGHPQKV